MGENSCKWEKTDKGYYLAVTTCQMCGKEYNNGNVFASKYCSECAAKVKREKTAERVRRYRENQKGIEGQ